MGSEPTQSDVAQLAGVSRGLVSLALSGSPAVAEATRDRILAAAEQLGYSRHLGAASLAAGRSPVVGVVLPDLRNPFFEGLVATLQAESDRHRLLPLVATVSNDPAREAVVLERFRQLRVAGAVLVSPVQPLADLSAAGRSLPLVLVGADAPGTTIDCVHMDEDAAARLVVDHLAARGWQRIVYLSSEAGAGQVWVDRRRSAIERIAAERSLPVTVVEVGADDGVAAELLPQLTSAAERVAVVAHNDLVAADAVVVLRGHGLVPGRDIAVVGFDDTHVARRPEYNFTSVSQNLSQLVHLALAALVERRAAEPDGARPTGREWVVTPSLSVRDSS